MQTRSLQLPLQELADICHRYRVRELALFGSAAKGNFTDESDVDLLVDFEADAQVGFLTLARMQRELSVLLGRTVDLVPKSGLKPLIRGQVLASMKVLYAA